MSVLSSDRLERAKAALQALNSLGSSEAIADHLGQLGIKGTPSSPSFCPVANYVKLVAGLGFRLPSIRATSWSLGVSDVDGVWATPPVVSSFITRFDAKHFPGLVM